MKRLRASAAAAVAVACVLAACKASKDPVQARLDQLEEAAEARDVEAFATGLAPGFRAGPFDRAGALAELRRYFALYDSVSLQVYGVEVERGPGRATVRCVVEFSGEGKKLGGLDKLLPPGAVYRFTLEMADQSGQWLVQSTTWEVVTPTAPSPG